MKCGINLLFFYSVFLSPLISLIDFFSPQPVFFALLTICLSLPNRCSFLKSNPKIFFLQIQKSNPKILKSNSQFKTKPKKNKGIGDGGEVELGARGGARDGEAMKIGVRAVSEVREGEVRCWSVHHNHGIRIDVGIDVEVRSECSSWSWASTLRWDRNRHWGEIGVFVTIMGIDVEILIMGIDVEVRWDLDCGLPVLVGFGCRCKWIRGFGLAMLVVSWV